MADGVEVVMYVLHVSWKGVVAIDSLEMDVGGEVIQSDTLISTEGGEVAVEVAPE